jgi:hypothetical protein
MSDSSEYIPPKVWTWEKASGGTFSNINRPIAGATHEKELPVGKHLEKSVFEQGSRLDGRVHSQSLARV